MPCRAVIFDFNGTLSDDEPILYAIYAKLFAEHGRPLTEAEYYRHLAGLSDPEIVHRWLGRRDDAEQVVHERVNRYREAGADGSTIHAGVRRAVADAAARVPIAIVSGAAAAEIVPVVAAAGLTELFTAVVTSDDISHGKPHPEGYLVALGHLRGRVDGPAGRGGDGVRGHRGRRPGREGRRHALHRRLEHASAGSPRRRRRGRGGDRSGRDRAHPA